jgi:hypothetical protein
LEPAKGALRARPAPPPNGSTSTSISSIRSAYDRYRRRASPCRPASAGVATSPRCAVVVRVPLLIRAPAGHRLGERGNGRVP